MQSENPHLLSQVGGEHYKKLAIQPAEFCLANMTDAELIGVLKWMSMKYVWRDKGCRDEDWEKTLHYIRMIKWELLKREEVRGE